MDTYLTLCVALALAEMVSGHRGGGAGGDEGGTRSSVLAIIEASGVVGNFENDSGSVPPFAQVVTQHAIRSTKRNHSGHMLIQNMSISKHPRSKVPMTTSLMEYGQGVLSALMLHFQSHSFDWQLSLEDVLKISVLIAGIIAFCAMGLASISRFIGMRDAANVAPPDKQESHIDKQRRGASEHGN